MFVRVRRGAAGREPADEGMHRDHDVAVVVFKDGQRADDFDLDAEFLAEFAGEGGGGRFVRLDFSAGKFPLEGEVLVRGALGDEHAARAVLEDGGDDRKGKFAHHEIHETHESRRAATFRGAPGSGGMKTFLKILLVALAVIVAIKLLPLALVLGCVVAGVAAIVAAVGVSLGAGLLAAGLLLALVLSPIWLPILALVGIVALIKKLGAKPAPRMTA